MATSASRTARQAAARLSKRPLLAPSPVSRWRHPVATVEALRSWSSTPRRRASEVSTGFDFPRYSPTGPSSESGAGAESSSSAELVSMSIPMETVERSPALLDALHDLAKIVEAKTGFNMQNGDMPGFSEMWKLRKAMSDPDFVSASVRVKQEMERAGIEIDPRMMEAFATAASKDWITDKFGSLTRGGRKKQGGGRGGKDGDGQDDPK